MSYEVAYCTACKVLQVKPELAAHMPSPEMPKWSVGFPAYCSVCRKNTEFNWTEVKLDGSE